MQGHGERIGQHRLLVGDRIGHGDEHRVVSSHQIGPAARGVGGHADVDPRAQGPGGEAPAQVQIPALAGRARRIHSPGTAGQPGVEQHPLADLETGGLRTERHDLGHHFVAGDVGNG